MSLKIFKILKTEKNDEIKLFLALILVIHCIWNTEDRTLNSKTWPQDLKSTLRWWGVSHEIMNVYFFQNGLKYWVHREGNNSLKIRPWDKTSWWYRTGTGKLFLQWGNSKYF